jgi:hypothetical protein
MARTYKSIAVVLFIFATLFSCGKKGPLQQIPPWSPEVIKNIDILQRGKYIYLEWRFPSFLSDKTNSLKFSEIRSVSIYSGTNPFNNDDFKRKSKSRFKLRFKELKADNGSFSVKILQKSRNLNNVKQYFGITYKYRRKHSPLSKPISLITSIPARPVTDFKLIRENKVVILTWTKPNKNIEGNPLTTASGYNVYRKIVESPDQASKFQVINKKNSLTSETFQDKETSREGTYFYYVVTTHSPHVESDPSKTISCRIKNIYPPDPPQNLVCIKDRKGLHLTWSRVKEGDLEFYRIFRKKSGEFEFKVLVMKITNNFFVDTGVKKGVKYFYQITAFDSAGNESEPSNTAREKF